MRYLLIVLMVVPPLISVVVVFIFRAQLKQFCREVPVIRSRADLDRLKRTVAGQMYVGLCVIPLLVLPLLAWAYGTFVAKSLTCVDILYGMLLPGIAMTVSGQVARNAEKEIHRLPVEDPALEAERDHVVRVWDKRLVPDW